MPNLIEVTYKQTGESTKTNQYGMREMQERGHLLLVTQNIFWLKHHRLQKNQEH